MSSSRIRTRLIQQAQLGLPNGFERDQAIKRLRRRPTTAEFNLYRRLLGNPTPSDRALAADVLGQIDSRRMRRDAESDLLFRAQEEQDPQVLEAILVALGHLGSPKPFQLFLRYATHESEDVRRAVAAFITEVAPERSDPRLVDALVGLASDT